jgi:hypothetical protein
MEKERKWLGAKKRIFSSLENLMCFVIYNKAAESNGTTQIWGSFFFGL